VRVLVVNAGSSSLKLRLLDGDDTVDLGDRRLVGLGDPRADAVAERAGRLAAGNQIPALLLDGAHERGIVFCCLHSQQPAFPLPQVHLAQLGFDARRDAETLRERRRRLDRASQGRHVDRGDVLAGESLGKPLGLVHARRVERRVAVPVDEVERPLGVDGLGLAVADEEDLGRARRRRVAMLAVRVGLALRLAHGSQDYGSRAVAS